MISNPSLMVLINHLRAAMTVGKLIPIAHQHHRHPHRHGRGHQHGAGTMTPASTWRSRPRSMPATWCHHQIDQTVTDVTDTIISATANNQPTFMQRQISSRWRALGQNRTKLGGLIRTATPVARGGVPLLHRIAPGNPFGTTTRSGARAPSCFVIITPGGAQHYRRARNQLTCLRHRTKGLRPSP